MILMASLIFYWMVRMRSRRVERQVLIKKDMIESQLQALKAQINPHFLYNSFFILNTMARVGDTKPLLVFTKQLGDYFRFIARNAALHDPPRQRSVQ